jgi:hypothetical protein
MDLVAGTGVWVAFLSFVGRDRSAVPPFARIKLAGDGVPGSVASIKRCEDRACIFLGF